MEITRVRCIRRDGTLEGKEPNEFYASRVARPIDVYEEFTAQSGFDGNTGGIFPTVADGELQVSQLFLEIETTTGLTGIVGPIDDTVAYLALGLTDLLVGRDPTAIEKLWDLMYRQEVHGRKGRTMMAISAIDCALWDLKGKHHGEPVYRLLGGPTRTELPAYASTFLSPTDPEAVREIAAGIKNQGYDAQKWYFQHGPGSGEDGKEANLKLVEAAREAVGPDHDLFFDAWMSWGRAYAMDMIDRLAPYDPGWLEEPVSPDQIDQYAALQERAPFPIAGGEHEYTRWGLHDLMDRGAVDIAQPDTLWAGGISELDKICTLGSLYDIPVVPHAVHVPANVHVTAAQPPPTSPLVEYVIKLNEAYQFFFQNPIQPENGTITVPDRPGLGVTIDEAAVESETAVDLQ